VEFTSQTAVTIMRHHAGIQALDVPRQQRIWWADGPALAVVHRHLQDHGRDHPGRWQVRYTAAAGDLHLDLPDGTWCNVRRRLSPAAAAAALLCHPGTRDPRTLLTTADVPAGGYRLSPAEQVAVTVLLDQQIGVEPSNARYLDRLAELLAGLGGREVLLETGDLAVR
jgi:hypothetical protein